MTWNVNRLSSDKIYETFFVRMQICNVLLKLISWNGNAAIVLTAELSFVFESIKRKNWTNRKDRNIPREYTGMIVMRLPDYHHPFRAFIVYVFPLKRLPWNGNDSQTFYARTSNEMKWKKNWKKYYENHSRKNLI